MHCFELDGQLGIATDASGSAIGYVIFDLISKRVIRFGSRMLSQTEKNYKDIKILELLGMAEACSKARYYISRASKVVLFCDNKNAI